MSPRVLSEFSQCKILKYNELKCPLVISYEKVQALMVLKDLLMGSILTKPLAPEVTKPHGTSNAFL